MRLSPFSFAIQSVFFHFALQLSSTDHALGQGPKVKIKRFKIPDNC